MKKLSLYVFLLLMFCNVAYASSAMLYKNYKNFSEEKEVILYIQTLYNGMDWTQRFYEQQKGVGKLYCHTETMTIDDLRDAIELSLKDFESRGHSSEDIDGYPMGIILMVGLPILFPCN